MRRRQIAVIAAWALAAVFGSSEPSAVVSALPPESGSSEASPFAATTEVPPALSVSADRIRLEDDAQAGRLRVLIGGKEAFVYQYGADLDLPHYWPLATPGGRNLLVQRTEPYPHHRSFWFADTVRRPGGREASFYNAYYSGVEQPTEPKTYKPPFRDRIRHVRFSRLDAAGNRAEIEAELLWEMDGGTALLREERRLVVRALGGGEYLMDLEFVLTPIGGEVEFRSDDVHYAWPYLRLQTRWSGEGGGRIVSDGGAAGQEATNLQSAVWVDYSNTVEGETAGVAVFQAPDGFDHRWLTREYGCFGPRRPDALSGKPFTLATGMSIRQRVGVLVHSGDVKTGRVAERYAAFRAGAGR
jgi:hypothetical protein